MPTAAVNGTELHYVDEGPRDAPAVLLSHSLFFDLAMFDALAADLAADHRVVRYDHRGQGGSARAPREQLDMDTLTDDAAALVEHLGLAPVHVLGNSMGGFVALRLALRRPDLVRSATVVGSSAEHELQLEAFEPLVQAMADANGTTGVIDVLLHIMFGDTIVADPAREAVVGRWREHMLALDGSIADAAWQVIHRVPVIDELGGVQRPLLVLAGEEDHAYPPERSEALAAAAGDAARLVQLPGAGHSASLEEPEAVLRELRSLLAETEGAAV